jgi:hypothetical protein
MLKQDDIKKYLQKDYFKERHENNIKSMINDFNSVQTILLMKSIQSFLPVNQYPNDVSTFASRTSLSTGQSLQKSFHLSRPDKIELKKIFSPSENKKYATTLPNDRQKSVALQTPKPLTEKRFKYSVDRRPACNSGFKKLGLQWLNEHSTSHQHLWWLDSLVLQNPQLLKPAKRYMRF